MKKSQSFRQDLASAELGSSPAPPLSPSPQDFPSLPVQPLRPDVILKKNKSMSSALSIEASHQRFRSSIENWSFANEGLKKSIGSLAEQAVPTTQSSESLKTISSLLEEPDMLEQTSVRGEDTRWEVAGEQRSWEPAEEVNTVWDLPKEETPKEMQDPTDEFEESNEEEEEDRKEVLASERPSAGEKSGSRSLSFIFNPRVSHLVLKLHLVSSATNNNDFADPAHASLAEALEDPSGAEDFAKETAEAERNEEANALDENLGGVEVETGFDGSNVEDYQPRYHDTTQPRYHADELEKLLGLADTSLDNKQTTFTSSSEIIDCSTEILESDLDLSINSTEVFHKSAMPVEEENDDAACDVNKDSEDVDVDKVSENRMEKQEEATIGAPDILLEEPKEQKPAEQPERERSASKSPGRRKLTPAWQNEQEHPVSQTSEEEPGTGPGVNQRRLSSNAFLERDSKVGESPVEEKVRQEYGNTFLANRKPSKSLEQGQAGVEVEQQNENERGEESTEPRKPNSEEDKEESVVELRRPGISPKPVPAPRHFFLRPTGKVASNGKFTLN